MSDPNQEDDWRQLGMEIIVTLAEEASAMFRKHCAGYLPVRVYASSPCLPKGGQLVIGFSDDAWLVLGGRRCPFVVFCEWWWVV